jgi:hypothetical protein
MIGATTSEKPCLNETEKVGPAVPHSSQTAPQERSFHPATLTQLLNIRPLSFLLEKSGSVSVPSTTPFSLSRGRFDLLQVA